MAPAWLLRRPRGDPAIQTRAPRSAWSNVGSDLPDPFAINPIRRSLVLVGTSGAVVSGALLAGDPVTTMVMLSVGWLAITGIVMGLPVLLLSLLDEGWRRLQQRLHPSVDQLDLSPRLCHVLRRHGYHVITAVERAPDDALLVLSNMDARGLHDVRRAVRLWHYRRWQEGGFR